MELWTPYRKKCWKTTDAKTWSNASQSSGMKCLVSREELRKFLQLSLTNGFAMRNSWNSKSKSSVINRWKNTSRITPPRKKFFKMIFKSMRLQIRACSGILILYLFMLSLKKSWRSLQSKFKFAQQDLELMSQIGLLQTLKVMAHPALSQTRKSYKIL